MVKKQPPFLVKDEEWIRKEVVRLLEGNGFLLEDVAAVHDWMAMEWQQPAEACEATKEWKLVR